PEGAGKVRITWGGAPIAALVKGQSILAPEIQLSGHPLLEDKEVQNCLLKLKAWMKAEFETHLEELVRLDRAVHNEKSDLPGLTRGLAFKVLENLGVVARHYIVEDIKALTPEDRKALHRMGFWFGANFLFMPKVLKPAPTKWRLALWGTWEGVETWPPLPEDGVMWAETLKHTPRGFYQTLGYRPVGKKAVRIDRLEKLFDAVRPLGMDNKDFKVTPEIMGLVGLSGDDFAEVMRFLGYAHKKEMPKAEDQKPEKETKAKAEEKEAEEPKPVYTFKWSPRHPAPFKGKKPHPGPKKGKGPVKSHSRPGPKKPQKDLSDSPFAALKDLKLKAGPSKEK
ncbi:MAG TPA: hypothetical protein VD713_01195, partial [Sphingomonadales bacterium]|nr:hypothetical protein [Sphingomonadales bacterium]